MTALPVNLSISIDIPATHLVAHIREEAGHEGKFMLSFGPSEITGEVVWTARYVGEQGDNEGEGKSISEATGALVKLLRKWRKEVDDYTATIREDRLRSR